MTGAETRSEPPRLVVSGAAALWPVTIDIVEWVAQQAPSSRLREWLELLCPTYAEVQDAHGLGLPAADDLAEQSDAVATADYLLRQLVQELCSVAPRCTIEVRALEQLNQTDLVFIVRLARAARSAKGLRILGSSAAPLNGVLWARGLPELCESDDSWPRRVVQLRDVSAGTALVGACPFGVPASCLAQDRVDVDLVTEMMGPDGETWLALEPGVQILDTTLEGRSRRQDALRALARRWPRDGWHYARRVGVLTAIETDWPVLRDSLGEAFLAYSAGWRFSYLHDYVLGFVNSLLASMANGPRSEEGRQFVVEAVLLLARVASGPEPEPVAGELLLQVQKYALGAHQRVRVDLEAGNVFARLRQPQHLATALRCLRRGLEEARALGEPERTRYRAHLLNALALVRYHQGRSVDALRLEKLATRIAEDSDEPAIRAWARSALKLNMAKLVERRFGQVEEALEHLSDSRRFGSHGVRSRATLESARILANAGDWQQCLCLLEEELSGALGPLSGADELWARMVCCVAATQLERPTQAEEHRRRTVSLAGQLGVEELVARLQASSPLA